MGRTETEWLRAAILANGGVCDDLPDNLESTLYKRLIEVCASGGGSGGSGGGGVQTDWNQNDENAADFLKNRPFGEKTGYSETLTVEMTREEIAELTASGQLIGEIFYKVADNVVIMSDLENGYQIDYGGELIDVPAESVSETYYEIAEGLAIVSEAFLIVDEQGVGVDIEGIIFQEKGVYINVVVLSELPYISLTIPGFQFATTGVKTLDEKYLPSHTVVFADNNYLYRDAGCTTKYNAGELPDLTRMLVNYSGIPVMPTTVAHGLYDYDIVGVNLSTGYHTFKTAEYTAT